MPIVGILLIVSLGILASLRFLFKWRAFQRIKQYGILIEAKVTAVKREERLATQLGGTHSTSQRLTYENVLYAQGHDPLTQQDYSFRIEVPDFSQFQVGEAIPIRMNRENPNEYRIDYAKSSKRSKRPEPHSESRWPI